MTKKQWTSILEELKTIRSTNKFNNNRIIYKHYDCVNRIGSDVLIDQVNVNDEYIMLNHRVYIRHSDVLDATPKEFKSRFWVTIPIF